MMQLWIPLQYLSTIYLAKKKNKKLVEDEEQQ